MSFRTFFLGLNGYGHVQILSRKPNSAYGRFFRDVRPRLLFKYFGLDRSTDFFRSEASHVYELYTFTRPYCDYFDVSDRAEIRIFKQVMRTRHDSQAAIIADVTKVDGSSAMSQFLFDAWADRAGFGR